MAITANLVIIALTCLVSWLAWKDRRLLGRLLLWPPAITRGHQWDRLVTYGLVHGDGAHLLFNMVTLFFFGRLIEQAFQPWLGTWGYVGFYVGGLIVSVLPSYLRHRQDPNYRSLGASGAVCAVLFAFILLDPWATIFLFVLPVPSIVYAVAYVGYSVWADRRGGDNINHQAHLWGAGYGILFSLIMEPRLIAHFLAQLGQPRFDL